MDPKLSPEVLDILDALPFYVLLVDADHHILLANKAVSRELRLEPEQIVGGYCPKIVHGLDHPVPGCPLEEAVRNGQITERELFDARSTCWLKSAVYPTRLRTQAGRAIFFHMVHNITEQKRAEEGLKESEARYRLLFDAAPVGIGLSDLEGNPLGANRSMQETMGFTLEELCTVGIGSIYVDTKERERVLTILRTSGRVRDFEARFRRKDGTPYYVLLNIDLMEWGGQKLALTTVRDITERKKAEDELKRSSEKLREALQGTIEALASAVEKRDSYTAGHHRRVSHLACAIARKMGLLQEQLEGIEMAGIIHDVGKIAIPSDILTLPRQLTEIEFSLIKTHPQAGYDILKTTKFPWPVARIVLQHHERMDGSGYPSGLSGEGILLEARILAVADVVEAMASHRPYRPAFGIDEALREISEKSGLLYDPEVVKACLKLFSEKRFKFE